MQGVRIAYQDLSTRGLTPRRSQPVEFNLRGQDFRCWTKSARDHEAAGGDRAGGGPRHQLPRGHAGGAHHAGPRGRRPRGVSMENHRPHHQRRIGGVREGKFTKDGRRYDVRLRLNPEERLRRRTSAS
jgi:hypothetical protein